MVISLRHVSLPQLVWLFSCVCALLLTFTELSHFYWWLLVHSDVYDPETPTLTPTLFGMLRDWLRDSSSVTGDWLCVAAEPFKECSMAAGTFMVRNSLLVWIWLSPVNLAVSIVLQSIFLTTFSKETTWKSVEQTGNLFWLKCFLPALELA